MNLSDLWPWLGAAALGAGLTFGAPHWRASREPAVRATAASDLVRLGAPIDGRDGQRAGGLSAGGLAALESAVDHSGPAGADFWSSHGVTAPEDGEEPPATGTVTVRFRDLTLAGSLGAVAEDGSRPAREDLFPERILSLDGREVQMEGFVQPLEARGSRITMFALLPFPPSCLFGGSLRADQQVEVDAKSLGGVLIHPFLPIRVEGRLAVGEELDSFGFVRSLYRIEAASVSRLQ